MSASDWISLGAALVAVGSVVLHLVLRRADREEARQSSIIAALQGEKESVGYEAYRLGESGWPSKDTERLQLRDALCLALIFEPSDRSRALINRAFRAYPANRTSELQEAPRKLFDIFEEAEKLARGDFDAKLGKQWDLHRAWNGLILLGTMLGNKEVVMKAGVHLKRYTP